MRVSMSIVGTATLVLISIGRPVGSQPIAPVGVEGQINTYTSDNQFSPSVGIDPIGRGAVVCQSWGSGGSDTMEYSIHGQRFVIPIFADGFESGDTTAWSSSAP